MNITVSIIMLVYERAEFIENAVRSVQAQDESAWEMIIVQDGDNSNVRSIVQRLAAADSRIRYHYRGKIGNIAQATNFGISLARGMFIAILDDDDEWCDNEKLRRQIMYLRRNGSAVACGTGVIVVDEIGNELMRYAKPAEDRQIRAVALRANPIAHSSAVFRRAAFQSVDGYDESLENFQDWDFWLKLGKIGQLGNITSHMLKYRLYQNSSSAKKMKSNAQSALLIVNAHRYSYPGYYGAWFLAHVYRLFSHLPSGVRGRLFSRASRLKKRYFSIR